MRQKLSCFSNRSCNSQKSTQFQKRYTCIDYYSNQNQMEIEDEDGNENLIKYYIKEADKMKKNELNTLKVDYKHIREWSANQGGFDLSYEIFTNYIKYEPFLHKTVQNFMYQLYTQLQQNDNERYYLSIYNLDNIQTIREMKTVFIGKLVSISGTITRTTEVRPELVQGNFLCLSCNTENKNIVQQFKFTEPRMCINSNCNNRTKWQLQLNGSQFSDFQKLRVQENSEEIPPGSMPRSIDVIVRDELTEKSKPGDRCIFVGSLIAVPDINSLLKAGERAEMHLRGETIRKGNMQSMDGVTGLKSLGVRELNYKLIFMAQYIQLSAGYDKMQDKDQDILEFNDRDLRDFQRIFKSNPYQILSKSIAPSVFGHDEIKKGLLLQIVGGVHKKTQEGIKLRGDLNVFLVGDPSTAKSQFLKFMNSFMPRSVYTSGKATSAAGLTASVLKDPETGELVIEAGALMLADNGICCIDEFDKMNSKDQVAIHEAMEQQTITISKAGIQATLNSRSAVLAAANPIYGRYDRTKSLKANVNLSAPIMSRFDLFFVVLDTCDQNLDQTLARHIVNLHQKKDRAIQENDEFLSLEKLHSILKYCKQIQPIFTKEAALAIRESYVALRVNDLSTSRNAYRITIRQLESLIRLSEAIAKVHGSDEVTPAYVREATKILSNSIIKVEQNDIQFEDHDEVIDQMEDKNQPMEKKKLKIKYEEYDNISRGIVYIFKQEYQKQQEAENQNKKEKDGEVFMTQSDAINEFISNNLGDVQDQKQGEMLYKICQAVIQKLIVQERVLIVVEDNQLPDQRKITLHPDYF